MQSEVNIWSLVKSLLHRNNCVIVPNLGGFLAHQQSATIDPLSMLITPPCKHITFNAQLTLNDGLLATKIADYLKISYSDAIKIIDEEVSNFHQTLKNNSQFVIEGLGHFELNENRNLVFSPDKKANFLINSFGLEVVRVNNIVSSKTTKIIPKVDLINNASVTKAENVILYSDSEEEDEATENNNKPVFTRGKKRRNSLMFSLIGSVLVFILGLNAYIFLQEGNLTPIRNKFNELDLGIKIQSVVSIFTNKLESSSSQSKEVLLNLYNPTSQTKEVNFKTELLEENKALEPTKTLVDTMQLVVQENAAKIDNQELQAETVSELNASFYIIAGAFKNEIKARKLLNELSADGFPNAEIIENPKASSKKLKYFVTYNKFSSLNESTIELGKINENENPDAWIFEAK